MRTDLKYMQEAIRIASMNSVAPFGSILVDQRQERIVATGVNQSSANPLWHGEIVAIESFAQRLSTASDSPPQAGAEWADLTLFTTAEPCCMCQGAILWCGISRVVFGTSIRTLQQLGWNQIDIPCAEVVKRSWRQELKIESGVAERECDELFRIASSKRAK